MDEDERQKVQRVVRAIQYREDGVVNVVKEYLESDGNPNGGAPARASSLLGQLTKSLYVI